MRIQNIVFFALIISIGCFTGCNDTKKEEKIPEKMHIVNKDIKKMFNTLQVGISNQEFNKVLKSSGTNNTIIGLIAGKKDEDSPIIDNFTTEDNICFYTKRDKNSYAGDRTDMIAIVIDKEGRCWDNGDYYYIKSLLLISRKPKSYREYDIIEQKHYNILKDPKLKKYNDGIAKAKRLHKPMVLVLYGYYKPHNIRLQNTLKSPTLKRLIDENFVFVEYLIDEAGHLVRTQIGDIHLNPNTFVFDKNGKYKTRIPGAIGEGTIEYDKYVKVLKSVVNE